MTMPKAILLDVSRLVWRGWGQRLPTGIDRTCLAYARQFRGRARAVIQRSGYRRVLPLWLSDRLLDTLESADGWRHRLWISVILTIAFYLPFARQLRGALYLNIGHTGLSRPGYGAWVRRKGLRPIYFVHDLIPILHPQYCRAGEDAKHAERMRHVLEDAAGIIVNSAQTLGEVEAFADSSGLPRPVRALVAQLGVEETLLQVPASTRSSVKGRPYFLILGTIEGRKNHILLLRLWQSMAQALGSACPRLIVVGQRGWSCDEALEMLDNCAEIRPVVTELPQCQDEDLARLLRGARALLFPSYAEGFGLPLIEALAFGTPVIASDLPVFRELAGDLPTYLDPDDAEGWRRAILAHTAPDSAMRAERAERIVASGYRAPDWSGHFALVEPWLAGFN